MASTKLLSSLSNARNLIYNPEGLLMQRIDPINGTAVNTDTYGPDRWNILCSANAVTVKQSTDAPANSRNSMQLSKSTSSGFMGMCQMLEASESIPLAGQFITYSIWLKSATLTSARIAVLGWNGTADTITSAVVSSWGATSTYIANVTELGAANVTVSSTWQQFSVTCLVSNANNLMFFVQTGTSATTSDSLFVSQVQVNQGTAISTYIRRADADEVQRCQRYYEKSYDLTVPPGTSNGAGNMNFKYTGAGSGECVGTFIFKVLKRVNPSVSIWGTNGTANNLTNSGGTNGGGCNVIFGGTWAYSVEMNSAVSTSFGELFGHFAADAEL